MSIPISTPTIVTMANPRSAPKPMYPSGIMAAMVVVAAAKMVVKALLMRSLKTFSVGSSPLSWWSTSSVIIIRWSMPVPMTAIMAVRLARSSCQLTAAANPRIITTSPIVVESIGIMTSLCL